MSEIINYPFDPELDGEEGASSEDRSAREISIDSPNTNDAEITYVNGHYLPDEEDEGEEDDLILGDEGELDEDDFDEDEIDVEVDDEVDEDIDEDDLVLDADNDALEEEDDDV
jgi:hypothetical protein